MKLTYLASLAALSIVLVGCDDDDDDNGVEPQQTALVRVVNASPSTATADLFVGTQSTALGSGIATGTAGAACFQVPAGTQALSFRQGGGATSIASATPFAFVAGQRYTVVLTGNGTTAGSRSAVVLTDDASIVAPTTGQNALRFFNATGATGNVYVTAPSATLGAASQTGLANNTATTGGTGGYTSYPSTSTQVRVFTGATTTGTPAVNFTLPTLTGNRIATVVLVGGTGGTQAVVATPCA